MAENQEQIESLLCGYVDDTLAPGERAEVEAHLAAHPQHRQLLSELRRMRQALQSLPRESAPAELSESFTGQLERSVLLEDIGYARPQPRMRIARLPQLAAVAAIIVLAGGLGIVVYYAWPSIRPPSQLVQNTHTSPGASTEKSDEKSTDRTNSLEPAVVTPKADSVPADQTPTNVPSAGPASVVGAAGAAPGGGAQLDHRVEALSFDARINPQIASVASSALSSAQVRALLDRADEAGQTGLANRPTVVMVVSTADLDATTRKLGNYLETNNTDWQAAAGKDNKQLQKEARTFGDIDARGKMPSHGQNAIAPGQVGGAGVDDAGNAPIPTTSPQTRSRDFGPGEPVVKGAYVPTTRPEGGSDFAFDTKSANAAAKDLSDKQTQITAYENRLYVVHNLSFQAAGKLSEMLARSGQGTQAPMFADKSVDGLVGTEKSFGLQQQLHPTLPRGSVVPATAPTSGAPAGDFPTTEQQAMQSPQLDQLATKAAGPSGVQREYSINGPQTNPSMPADGVVRIDKDALLGSSPVNLVIVVQDTARPVSQIPAIPATSPAAVPSTEPTTKPIEN